VTPFRPLPFTRGGHRQTLLGYWQRRRLRWTLGAEDHLVSHGDAQLLIRATWQPGPRAAHAALVIVHGLGGSDAAAYVLSAGLLAFSRGLHVIRMNMRGAGDGEAHCPLLYNAGLDGDVIAVLGWACRAVPKVLALGFSLGGNQLLLAAGRQRERMPGAVAALATVSAPLDLAACADALERRPNLGYQHYFMVALRDAYGRRALQYPDLFPAGLERGLTTVRAFDRAITAPFGGYASVEDYYARASAGPWVPQIERPTMLLHAADDPFVPADAVARWPRAASAPVTLEMLPTGGHVGFVAPCAAPGRFWAAERTLDFLTQQLS
jgi:predicted alpha/beta-fold hydrolase